MIKDARNLAGGETLTTRICIVGGGAAGISFALQFLNTGVDVLLLEAGGLAFEADTQDLYAGEVADAALHSPPHQYRRRQFGGSTAIWGGRCVPFDPIDFETRPWIEGSGWPIQHEEVARYYPAANALCDAGASVFSAQRLPGGGMRPMIKGFEPAQFDCDGIERFSHPTDFGKRYRAKFADSASINVMTHANVTEIVTDASTGKAASAVVRTLSGKQFEVKADYFVLATGGLETPRLLLDSRRNSPNGVGNRYDHVGRNYMCHIAGTIGELKLNVPTSAVSHGYERDAQGIYCRRRIALRSEAQRRLEVGNVIFRLHHPRLSDPGHGRGILSAIYLAKPLISAEYSKRLHSGEKPTSETMMRHVYNVVREPLATASFLTTWFRERTLATRKFPSLIIAPRNNTFSLDINGEQAPNRDSRVMLSPDKDKLGAQRLKIDWRWKALDLRTVEVALAALKKDFAAWGSGELSYDPDSVGEAMLRDGAYGGHHIGTTRMSRTPIDGVVDSNCCVHGASNLLIASSAVFPTSSQANPTLTIVALALRAADYVKQRLAGRPVIVSETIPDSAELVRPALVATAGAA